MTNGRVLMTGCVVLERINTNGRVTLARGVALKCAATDGRFIGGCCVVQKGSTTDCCVVAPGLAGDSIARERLKANGCVALTVVVSVRVIILERLTADGGV